MKVSIVRHTASPESLFADAAAICVGKAKGTPAGMKSAIRSGHESLLEHASFTFLVEGVSRVLLAQLTRHRMASYTVESQRYAGVEDGMIIPQKMHDPAVRGELVAAVFGTQNLYDQALAAGIPSEDARYATLQGATTKVLLTMNARELKHFFALRCCTRAQWEIRELANKMLALVCLIMPSIFKPNMAACDQNGFCREDKCCGRAPTLKSLLLKQSLNELRDAIYEDAEVHGLWDTVKESKVKPLENHMRYEAARRVGYEVREAMDAASQPEHFAEELADVVITALSAAGLMGIDIEKEVKAKMAINKERSYQHKEE